MKGILNTFLVTVCSAFLFSTAYAAKMANASDNWTCETNASSSSVPADKNADKMMTKNMKSAKAAFAYALQNCRDCTKITCNMNKS